jgi:biopolymer transport protein ExbB
MQQFGMFHFWVQGDFVSRITAIVLLLLSLASWYVMIAKGIGYWRAKKCHKNSLDNFWEATNLDGAIEKIKSEDSTQMLSALAVVGVNASLHHKENASRGIGAGVSASEFVTRALRNQIDEAQMENESGLTFLASVGSTAPFIGLFGTVWGIYHALVGLSGATSVVLDRVAGPVGEALIMTAAGLFVAIPAVLAFNTFNRHNRRIMARLDGFAHDLHIYLTTGARAHVAETKDRIVVSQRVAA